MKLFDMLRELNDVSPFTWEIITDGYKYTFFCEEIGVHDPDTDTDLENLSLTEAEVWLEKILRMEN